MPLSDKALEKRDRPRHRRGTIAVRAEDRRDPPRGVAVIGCLSTRRKTGRQGSLY